jgi:hypothetical protein
MHAPFLPVARAAGPLQRLRDQERAAAVERRKMRHSRVERPAPAQKRRIVFEFFLE